jgi:hypothetical protein
MKMKFLTPLIFLFPTLAYTQNLLLNGGFEDYSNFPTGVMQSNFCVGWSKCNQGGGGTPDYFHMNGSGLIQLPNSFYATINPHGGSAIMGVITYHSVTTDFREYIAHELNSPLTVGQAYNISYFISNGVYNGNYGGCGSNNFGVAFTTTEPIQSGTTPMSNIVPQHALNTIQYSETWQQITFSFVADSAYRYITLGNFQNNNNTLFQNFENNPVPVAYYFIDDIVVEPKPSSDIAEVSAENNVFIYDAQNNVLRFIKQSDLNSQVRIFDLQGKMKYTERSFNCSTINTSNFPKGIYFVELIQNNVAINRQKIVVY